MEFFRGIPLPERLAKPWFVYRPAQLIRRGLRGIRGAKGGPVILETGFGRKILADPQKLIGRSIWLTGFYEFALSEVLFRLAKPGAFIVDAGANIGSMSALMGWAAGEHGRLLAFEPHPDNFKLLERNIALSNEQGGFARAEIHNTALGAAAGTAALTIPDHFGGNEGVPFIGEGSGKKIEVALSRLDDFLGPAKVDLCKIDVEGYELEVLKGAAGSIEAGRISHIVYEDYLGASSPVHAFLRERGYETGLICWSLRGPYLADPGRGDLKRSYDSMNFLAARDFGAARAKVEEAGWKILEKR